MLIFGLDAPRTSMDVLMGEVDVQAHRNIVISEHAELC